MFNGRALTLDEYIENFRKLIEMSWDHVASIEPYPDTSPHFKPLEVGETLGDWLQMQWEYLVEGMLRWTGQLDGYLESYGDGTDSGFGCRYYDNDAEITHRVCVLPREGTSLPELIGGKAIPFPENGLPFDRFVTFSGGWYDSRPPLDHVLVSELPTELESDYDFVFRLEDVRFALVEIEPLEGFTRTILTRRELFILIEDEIRRFREEAAMLKVRKLLIEPADTLRYGGDDPTAVRVSMVIRVAADVTIGYRHTEDRARWGVFRPDITGPIALGPESSWYEHLEEAFYNSPAWDGEGSGGQTVSRDIVP